MALGRKNRGNNGKLLVLRIKNKDDKDVPLVPNLFEISEKDETTGTWVKRPQMEDAVGGNLTRLEFEDKVWENTPYKIVKAYLTDEEKNETYLLDLRYTNLSRNLYNCLLALKSFDGINISMYAKKSKTDGKEYANISVWQGDTMVKGLIPLDQIPKADEIKDKKGNVVKRDFTEVDAFFEKALKELAERVNNAPATPAPAKPAASNEAAGADEDVLF